MFRGVIDADDNGMSSFDIDEENKPVMLKVQDINDVTVEEIKYDPAALAEANKR